MLLNYGLGVSVEEVESTNTWLFYYANSVNQKQLIKELCNPIVVIDNDYISFPTLFVHRKNHHISIVVSDIEAQIHGCKVVKSKLSIPCVNCCDYRKFLFQNYFHSLNKKSDHLYIIQEVLEGYNFTYQILINEIIKIKYQLSLFNENENNQKTFISLSNALKFTKAKISRVKFDREVINNYLSNYINLDIAA